MVLKSLMPAYGGYTIARDERVILIKGAIPGEVVEVTIEEKEGLFHCQCNKCNRGFGIQNFAEMFCLWHLRRMQASVRIM